MRPRELKKLQHEARCALLDEEHNVFVVLVGFIVDLVPLALEARAAKYVRIRLRQPETEQRLHWLLASVFRVPTVHFPDLAPQVEHKENAHVCYSVAGRPGFEPVNCVLCVLYNSGMLRRRHRSNGHPNHPCSIILQHPRDTTFGPVRTPKAEPVPSAPADMASNLESTVT